MVRKTKEEAEQTRKDIIEAARRTFHQYGVSRSTCERIAKAAGVTRGAVYWHFRDKAEIFFALRRRFSAADRAPRRAALRGTLRRSAATRSRRR
jgi:AcrR family transcriptional regulator